MLEKRAWRFVGRTSELAAVLAHVRRGDGSVLIIQGPRRAGTTSLVQAVIARTPRQEWRVVSIPDGGPGPFLAAWARTLERLGIREEPPGSLPAAADLIHQWTRSGVHVVLDGVHRLSRPDFRPFLAGLHVRHGHDSKRRPGGIILVGVHGEDLDRALVGGGRTTLASARRVSLGDLEPHVLAGLCGSASRAQALHALIGGMPGRWRWACQSGATGVAPDRMLDRLVTVGDLLHLEAEVSFGPMLIGRMGEILQCLANAGPLSYGELRQNLVPAAVSTRDEPSSYLRILESRFRIIARESGGGRAGHATRYTIVDPFLITWLRVLLSASSAAEVK